MQKTPPSPNQVAFAKRLSQACLLALIALYTATSWLQTPINWTVWLAPCFSLAIFLPGMLKDHPRSYDWLCFVTLIHFTVAVTNTMAPSASWNDYVQLSLSVVLFISAMMTSRWLKAKLASSTH